LCESAHHFIQQCSEQELHTVAKITLNDEIYSDMNSSK